MGVLENIASFVAGFGLIVSLNAFVRRWNFNNKLEALLIEKKSKIEIQLLELEISKEISKQKELSALIEELEIKKLQVDKIKGSVELKIHTEDLDLMQKSIKNIILGELTNQERNILVESLEQKHLSGQIDYLNKLLHLSGINKNVKIITESKSNE